MPAFARTVGLLIGCLSLVLACSQPRPGPVEAEADGLADEDLPDQGDDGSPSVDAAGDQADSATGSGDADTLDTAPPACTPVDCADGWACTLDTCTAGVCSHLPLDATPCDDGDPCTMGESCFNGSCGGASDVNCDDGNGCTVDSCEPGKGCEHKPGTGACSDGDACTTGETCTDGACAGGAAKFCGDGNFCTDDACDSAKGCVFSYNSAPCDSDSNICTVDKCAGGSCAYLPVAGTTTACDDGSPCTQEDHCEKGKCVGAAVVWTVPMDGYTPPLGFGVRPDFGVATADKDSLYIVDWGGKVHSKIPMNLVLLAGTTSGWAYVKANPNMLVFADPSGAPKAQVPWPVVPSGIVGDLITGSSDSTYLEVMNKPGPWQIIAVNSAGSVAQTWSVPSTLWPEGNPMPRKAGGYLWPCEEVKTTVQRLCLFQPTLGSFEVFSAPALAPLGYPYTGWATPQRVTEATDASIYLVQTRLAEPKPGTLAVYLWHASSDGALLWSLVLPIPKQPTDSDQGWAAVAALADDTVEVWAYPDGLKGATNYNQGHTSWRIRSDGTVIWRQDEAERRRLATTITAKGYGVVAPASYTGPGTGTTTPPRLTRSDAFGNITCADSGPCWDKPATYCDDGDPCTNDLCAAWWKGCHHEPFADGMPCKPGKTCQKGKCLP